MFYRLGDHSTAFYAWRRICLFFFLYAFSVNVYVNLISYWAEFEILLYWLTLSVPMGFKFLCHYLSLRIWITLPEDFPWCLLSGENLSLTFLPAVFYCYFFNAHSCATEKEWWVGPVFWWFDLGSALGRSWESGSQGCGPHKCPCLAFSSSAGASEWAHLSPKGSV